MSYLSQIIEEADRFEDRKIFNTKWSERNWLHLMKLYRYSNRARGLVSRQQKQNRTCVVPSFKKQKHATDSSR